MAHLLAGRKIRDNFHALRDELFEAGLAGPDPAHFQGSMYAFRATLASLERLVVTRVDNHSLKDEGRLAVAHGYLWYIRDFLAVSEKIPPFDEMEHEAQRALDLLAEIKRPKGSVKAGIDRTRNGLQEFVGKQLAGRRERVLQRT